MTKTLLSFSAMLLLAIELSYTSQANADSFGTGANSFDIEFATVGNRGNAADSDDGNIFQSGIQQFGSVNNTYRIGKFEVSRGMIASANAEAGLAIALADMSGNGGNGADRPANGVSWNEAARFVNWLNTSRGFLPAYKFALQPGDVGYDVNANILLWNLGDTGYNPNNLFRNSLARYVLPSVDEWYKAAYYDPLADAYYDFPTGSDVAPTSVASGTGPATAVYGLDFLFGHPTDVMFAGGPSPSGSMGQGGNIAEWQETESDLTNDSSASARSYRGGHWASIADGLSVVEGGSNLPIHGGVILGFRVASVIPEPTSLMLGLLAGLVVMICKRQR